MEALFEQRRRRPLIEALQGDLETNPRNYREQKLKPDEELEPLHFAVYKDMDVFLTKNVRKDIDFVNGMLARALNFNPQTQSLRVKTRTGHLIKVWRYSDWRTTPSGQVTVAQLSRCRERSWIISPCTSTRQRSLAQPTPPSAESGD